MLTWLIFAGPVTYNGFPFISQVEYPKYYACMFMTKSSKKCGKSDNDSFVYMTANVALRFLLGEFSKHCIANAASYISWNIA